MSEIRSQATPARDELAEAIKGYGKSFLGECEEVDVAKIEHSFDCMADGLADYLTEDDGWSKPRTVNIATELDALPMFTVIRSEQGSVWERQYGALGKPLWIEATQTRGFPHTSDEITLPATVLSTPRDAG